MCAPTLCPAVCCHATQVDAFFRRGPASFNEALNDDDRLHISSVLEQTLVAAGDIAGPSAEVGRSVATGTCLLANSGECHADPATTHVDSSPGDDTVRALMPVGWLCIHHRQALVPLAVGGLLWDVRCGSPVLTDRVRRELRAAAECPTLRNAQFAQHTAAAARESSSPDSAAAAAAATTTTITTFSSFSSQHLQRHRRPLVAWWTHQAFCTELLRSVGASALVGEWLSCADENVISGTSFDHVYRWLARHCRSAVAHSAREEAEEEDDDDDDKDKELTDAIARDGSMNLRTLVLAMCEAGCSTLAGDILLDGEWVGVRGFNPATSLFVRVMGLCGGWSLA